MAESVISLLRVPTQIDGRTDTIIKYSDGGDERSQNFVCDGSSSFTNNLSIYAQKKIFWSLTSMCLEYFWC